MIVNKLKIIQVINLHPSLNIQNANLAAFKRHRNCFQGAYFLGYVQNWQVQNRTFPWTNIVIKFSSIFQLFVTFRVIDVRFKMYTAVKIYPQNLTVGALLLHYSKMKIQQISFLKTFLKWGWSGIWADSIFMDNGRWRMHSQWRRCIFTWKYAQHRGGVSKPPWNFGRALFVQNSSLYPDKLFKPCFSSRLSYDHDSPSNVWNFHPRCSLYTRSHYWHCWKRLLVGQNYQDLLIHHTNNCNTLYFSLCFWNYTHSFVFNGHCCYVEGCVFFYRFLNR